ncbi:hypothetical protein RAS1_10530 [Phycisphaerae bacterium RAS1]|nr:hypothetical protein RAS1_10530 [Phycisphaerae bacterium RAS1]
MNRLRMPTVLMALFSLAPLPAPPAADQADEYAGKYARDPRFKKSFADLDKLADTAFETACARLGVAGVSRGDIRVVVADALDPMAETLGRYTDEPFQTRSIEGGKAQIVIHPEFILNGVGRLSEELTHEMTHAVMRLALGEKYAAVPRWLREGLALHAAGQVEQRVQSLMRLSDVIESPQSLIIGLEQGSGLQRYAEYGLAIEFLVKQHGAEVLATIVAKLKAGEAGSGAVAAAAAMTWKDFEGAARQYALDRITALRPPETSAYLQIVQADRDRKYGVVKQLTEGFLRQQRNSVYRGDVLYWRGKACRLLKERSEAEKALKEVLARHRDTSSYVDESLYQLAMVRIEARAFVDARKPLRDLLCDHPDTPLQDRAVYNLALCALETGQRKEAQRLLDVFDRSFTGSRVEPNARELRTRLAR